MRLLAVLGRNPITYDAGLIRRAILAEAQQCSPSYVKTMTTALRGYLRFPRRCRDLPSRARTGCPARAAVATVIIAALSLRG